MGDGDPSSAIAPVPAQITPPEFFDQSAMISNDLDRVSGVSDYQRGAQTQIKRTATEAAMIQDASNSRSQDRLAKIERTLSEIAANVVGLMQQYVTGDKVARISTMPVKAWINYDSDRIQGKFDFEVQGGSTEPQNETFRRQSAMQLVDVSMPFMQAGVVNAPALYHELLQKGFGIKDAQRLIQSPEQQQEQQQQQGPPPQGQLPPGGPPPGGPPPGGGGMQQGPPPGAMPPQNMPGGPPPGGPPPEIMQMLQQLPPELAQQIMQEIPPEIMQQMTPEMLQQVLQQITGPQQQGPPQGGPPMMA
jgi:hypothetical protein